MLESSLCPPPPGRVVVLAALNDVKNSKCEEQQYSSCAPLPSVLRSRRELYQPLTTTTTMSIGNGKCKCIFEI